MINYDNAVEAVLVVSSVDLPVEWRQAVDEAGWLVGWLAVTSLTDCIIDPEEAERRPAEPV